MRIASLKEIAINPYRGDIATTEDGHIYVYTGNGEWREISTGEKLFIFEDYVNEAKKIK